MLSMSKSLYVGQKITTFGLYGVGKEKSGVIKYIDGSYIGVRVPHQGGFHIIEAYPCECIPND